MPTNPANKVECHNPNTGGHLMTDADTYELFSKAIYHTLKKEKVLTYTQMVEGIHDYFREQHISFDGSVEWYAVTIKNDMQVKGVIDIFSEKGKKLHRLNIQFTP